MSVAASLRTDQQVRCAQCGRLLALVITRPWRIVCPRCKAENGKAA